MFHYCFPTTVPTSEMFDIKISIKSQIKWFYSVYYCLKLLARPIYFTYMSVFMPTVWCHNLWWVNSCRLWDYSSATSFLTWMRTKLKMYEAIQSFKWNKPSTNLQSASCGVHGVSTCCIPILHLVASPTATPSSLLTWTHLCSPTSSNWSLLAAMLPETQIFRDLQDYSTF